jgi:Lipopolysaccharide-assembly
MILKKNSFEWLLKNVKCKMKSKFKSVFLSLFIINFSFCISSCGVYTFNSSSIDYEKIKTISVLNFTMATAGGPANLPLQLNEKLKEYYQRNTKLRVIPNNGDMILEGSITGYEVLAAAPTSQDQAALNRLTVTVEVKFTNNKDETKNFEQNFSFYQDYPQNQTLSQNESRLVPKILDQIVQDIFNKSAGDW